MSQNGDILDGATAFGDGPAMFTNSNKPSLKSPNNGYGYASRPNDPVAIRNGGNAEALPFVDSSNFFSQKRPLCVPIGPKGVRHPSISDI